MGNILLGRVILSVIKREKEGLLCPLSFTRTGQALSLWSSQGEFGFSVNKLLFIARFVRSS